MNFRRGKLNEVTKIDIIVFIYDLCDRQAIVAIADYIISSRPPQTDGPVLPNRKRVKYRLIAHPMAKRCLQIMYLFQQMKTT